MTENRRETGPGKDAGPAREQVVIKDKRKIDSSGRPKASEAADTSKAASPEQSEAAKPAGRPEATMGQPGRGDGAAVSDDAAAEAVTSDETVTPDDIVAGEIVVENNDSSGAGSGAGNGGGGGRHQQVEPDTAVESLRSELDERVRDLQRVSAEYANYRKRVDRDRAVVVEQAMGQVINSLLPILDDLDRARDHDDLVGPFAAMAEQLTAALSKFGLTGFGEPGDAFDPTRHEAVAHQTSAEVTEPSCVAVMRRGYLLGDRLLRPALVAVADPE